MTAVLEAPVRLLPAPVQTDVERVTLKDGATATVRPACWEDREALHDLFEQLSPTSRYRRFFSLAVPGMTEIEGLCETADPSLQLTLVVTRVVEGVPLVIATASYYEVAEGRAEVAFTVADGFQGKGLGTLLLKRLAKVAAQYGIVTFEAVTLAENVAMMEVFRRSGFPMETYSEGTLMLVALSLVP
jgi:GNAT superfamily N-acetyltransferase